MCKKHFAFCINLSTKKLQNHRLSVSLHYVDAGVHVEMLGAHGRANELSIVRPWPYARANILPTETPVGVMLVQLLLRSESSSAHIWMPGYHVAVPERRATLTVVGRWCSAAFQVRSPVVKSQMIVQVRMPFHDRGRH